MTCRQFSDHDFDEPRLVETGRHPVLGRFNRYVARCAHCPRTETQTEWLDRQRPTYESTQ